MAPDTLVHETPRASRCLWCHPPAVSYGGDRRLVGEAGNGQPPPCSPSLASGAALILELSEQPAIHQSVHATKNLWCASRRTVFCCLQLGQPFSLVPVSSLSPSPPLSLRSPPILSGVSPNPWAGAGGCARGGIGGGQRSFRQQRAALRDQSTRPKTQAIGLGRGYVCASLCKACAAVAVSTGVFTRGSILAGEMV